MRRLEHVSRFRDMSRCSHLSPAADIHQRSGVRTADDEQPAHVPRLGHMPWFNHLQIGQLCRQRNVLGSDLRSGRKHLFAICRDLRATSHVPGESVMQRHRVLRHADDLHRFSHVPRNENMHRSIHLRCASNSSGRGNLSADPVRERLVCRTSV